MAPARLAAYWRDLPRFLAEAVTWRLGEAPTVYQVEIARMLTERGRVAVRGPHALGKTALSALAVLWFALTREAAGRDWKVITTASGWRQLEKYLWPEVHKWARRLVWALLGRPPFVEGEELLALSLKLPHGEAFAVASDKADFIEGAHADSVLYVFDEAKAIPRKTFEAAEGAFAGAGSDTAQEAYGLAISTPGEPEGAFYDIHARRPGLEDWWARHVTLEEAITAGRLSREWAERRRRQWGETSAVYQNRVLGEFAASDADGIIPLAWVEAANERWRAWADTHDPAAPFTLTTVGVDVATTGEAKTVLALREDVVIRELRRYTKQDTMATAGRVAAVLRAHGGLAVVDVIGLGAGVVHRLQEDGLAVVAFNAAEASTETDRLGELGFANRRSAAWWGLREQLDPAYGAEVALPPDDLLTGDLTAPKWTVRSGGKIQIEPKEEIAKRLGRSTDDGDAVVQAFVNLGWTGALETAGAVGSARTVTREGW